jgi:hypothetical protein
VCDRIGLRHASSPEMRPEAPSAQNWADFVVDVDTATTVEPGKLSGPSEARHLSQREKRDRYFVKGPLSFGWVRVNIPDPSSRLILVAKAFMDMDGSVECILSAKVWDCANVSGKDARRRVLQKIQKSVVGFEAITRPGRPSILRSVDAP